MKTPLFVDVDSQFDFCDPAGALFVNGAPQVVPNIVALVKHAERTRALLVGSVDTHDFTAWEFKDNGGPFPPHCVKGTRGWLKMPGTLLERTVFVPDVARSDHRELCAKKPDAILFEKEVYSMFANREAARMIDALLERDNVLRDQVEAIVFGIATDYCVKEAALGLLQHGFDVMVVTDAIAPVTDEGGREALEAMERAGCRFTTTRQFV